MSALRIAATRGLARALIPKECLGMFSSSGLGSMLSSNSLGTAGASSQQQVLPTTAAAFHQPMAMPFGLQPVRHYSQCDCPTLGGPQPDIVVVEYDEDEVDRFIALADAIEAAFPNIVVEGNPEGSGRPGSFEVKAASGQLLHSKLSSGSWPEADSVVEALAAAAACDVSAAGSQ